MKKNLNGNMHDTNNIKNNFLNYLKYSDKYAIIDIVKKIKFTTLHKGS